MSPAATAVASPFMVSSSRCGSAALPITATPRFEPLAGGMLFLQHWRRPIPARAKTEAAAAPAAAKPAAEARRAAPVPAAAARAPAAPVAAADADTGLALPDPDEWEIPIVCFRCNGEYTVPFRYFRAGVVFSCPHCQGTFVPTLSMVRGVEEALAQFHARWRRAFEQVHERRRREVEQFEERQRMELEQFSAELRAIATREKAPGAPTKRKGFFTF